MAEETKAIYAPRLHHYKSPNLKMGIVLVFLTLFAAATVAAIVSTLMEQSLLHRALNNEYISWEEATSNDARQIAVQLLWIAAYLATAIVFLSWLHRTSSNMHAMTPYGEERPRFSVGWSIGWWFVPIMSWFRPHQVMRELWRRSHPNNEQPLLLLMWVWWGLFLVTNLVSWILFRSLFSSIEVLHIDTLIALNYGYLFTHMLDGVTALLLGIMVWQISTQQVQLRSSLTSKVPLEPAEPSTVNDDAPPLANHREPAPPAPTPASTPTIKRKAAITAALAAFLIAALLFAGGTVLYVDTNQELDRTKARLHAKEQRLADVQLDLTSIRADLSNTSFQLTQERTIRNRLQTERNDLAGENESLSADLDTANTRIATLTNETAAVTASLQDTTEHLTNLQTNHDALNTKHNDLQLQHNSLVRTIHNIDNLKSQEASLRKEVQDLRDERRPLILGRTTTGFACTGSMEPKLTCLDEGTFVTPTDPATIVVGSTITFDAKACWPDDASNATYVHRVQDIRVDSGTHFYWPKGDANREPDGCWIPFDAIDSYLVAVNQDAFPANADLRNNVNAARNSYYAALDEYTATWNEYVADRVKYGCPRDVNAQCTARSRQAAFDLIWGFRKTRYQYALLESADRRLTCWENVAVASQYPGHIPALPCRFVIGPPIPPPVPPPF